MGAKSRRAYLILPLCLLYLNVLQEVVLYKMRDLVPNPYLLTGILLAAFALGFTLVGTLLAPWLEGLFETGHKVSKKQAGGSGILVFHGVMLAIVYGVYFVVYTRGPQYLLPPTWR
jgi:hypothetical protein